MPPVRPMPGRTVFRFASMLEPQFKPNLSGEGTEAALHPALTAMLQSEIAAGAGPLVFAAISGNEHHFLGMVNHPRRFDFVLRERPHLPLWPGAEIVPPGLVAAALARFMAGPANAARRAPPRHPPAHPLYLLAAAGAGQRLRRAAGDGVLRADQPAGRRPARLALETLAPADPALRRDLRRARHRLPAAAARGARREGFLRREAWHADCVHANHWYGERVLRQIEARAQALQRAAA